MTGDRDLRLKPRKENTRPKQKDKVIVFSLENIKQHFDESMMHIQQQFDVAQALIEAGNTTDAENVWRSQIVFLDSAFDFYLHELTKFGLEKIFTGDWGKTTKYNNLKVKIPYVERALDNPENTEWFAEYANDEFSRMPMMAYDAVKDQLNLLGINVQEVANRAFYDQGSTEKTKDKLKRRINELYNRRNLIAHQSDRLPHNAQREIIIKEIVNGFVDDIRKIVEAIHSVALEK